MRDFHGKTLMHVAAHNCNHAMLRELHSLGADINAGIESSQSNGGETPLFHACVAPSGIFPPQYPEDAYIKTLETLFELGADPKAKNKHGYSAVDVAIQPTWEALEIMVKHGVEDKNGRAKKSVSVLVGVVVGYGMNFLGQIRDRLF
jgi:ankyrin repeat protein